MAKETFSPRNRFRNTFLAIMVAGAMKSPIENWPHRIEEDLSCVDGQKAPVHTFYFPQTGNTEEINNPPTLPKLTPTVVRQLTDGLTPALEETPNATLPLSETSGIKPKEEERETFKIEIREGENASSIASFYGVGEQKANQKGEPKEIVIEMPPETYSLPYKKISTSTVSMSITPWKEEWNDGEAGYGDLIAYTPAFPYSFFGHTAAENQSRGTFAGLRSAQIGDHFYLSRSWEGESGDWLEAEVAKIVVVFAEEDQIKILKETNSQLLGFVTCFTEANNPEARLIVLAKVIDYQAQKPPVDVEQIPPQVFQKIFLFTTAVNPTTTTEPTLASRPREALAKKSEESKTPEAAVEIYRPIYWGDRHRPEVALTFDDGFSAQAIQTTLEVLRANNIQGTFFVVGSQLRAYPDLWRQAVADGHQICNHTYTHVYLSSLSEEEIKKELVRWEAAAQEVLGEEYVQQMKQEFPYVRFPSGAGHGDERVLRAVAEAGYRPIAWSQETYAAVLKNHDLKNEAVAPIADEVRQHTVNAAQNGTIILLHFNSWDTLYLEQIVKGLVEKGLTSTSVSQVLD